MSVLSWLGIEEDVDVEDLDELLESGEVRVIYPESSYDGVNQGRQNHTHTEEEDED